MIGFDSPWGTFLSNREESRTSWASPVTRYDAVNAPSDVAAGVFDGGDFFVVVALGGWHIFIDFINCIDFIFVLDLDTDDVEEARGASDSFSGWIDWNPLQVVGCLNGVVIGSHSIACAAFEGLLGDRTSDGEGDNACLIVVRVG